MISKIYKSLTFADIHNTCDVLILVFEDGSQSDRHIDGKIDAKLKKGAHDLAQYAPLIGQNTVKTPLPVTVDCTDYQDVASLKNPNIGVNSSTQQPADCRYRPIYSTLPVLDELFKRQSQASITCVKFPLSTRQKTRCLRHLSTQLNLSH